jgi:transcription initiation factor TFIIIB Brf1 subunit/transcription initiation factor TFIIB
VQSESFAYLDFTEYKLRRKNVSDLSIALLTIFGTVASVTGVVLYVFNGTRKTIGEIKNLTGEIKELIREIHQQGEQRHQEIVKEVAVADYITRYVLKLVRQTRVHKASEEEIPEFIKQWVNWGAGPRASQYIITTARARAILQGRFYVTSEDVKYVAYPVLRHRIIKNFSAEAEGITTDKIIDKLIETTALSENELLEDQRLPKIFASVSRK